MRPPTIRQLSDRGVAPCLAGRARQTRSPSPDRRLTPPIHLEPDRRKTVRLTPSSQLSAESSDAVTVSEGPQVTLWISDCSSAGELPRPSRERSGRLRGNPIGGSGTILSEGRGEPRPTLRNSVSASATALRLRCKHHLRRVRASSVDTRLLSLGPGARREVSLDS